MEEENNFLETFIQGKEKGKKEPLDNSPKKEPMSPSPRERKGWFSKISKSLGKNDKKSFEDKN